MFATGMQTQLGRIAALSQRIEHERARWSARSARSHGSSRSSRWLSASRSSARHPVAGLSLAATRCRSRSGCWSATSPRACSRRSPSPSRWAYGAGAPRGTRQAAARGRDARLDDGHLHGQDRDADREPHAGPTCGRPRREARPRRRPRSTRAAARPRSRDAMRPPATTASSTTRRTAVTQPRPRCCARPQLLGDGNRARREDVPPGHFHFDPALKLMSTIDDVAGSLSSTPRAPPKRSSRGARTVAGDGAERPLDEPARRGRANVTMPCGAGTPRARRSRARACQPERRLPSRERRRKRTRRCLGLVRCSTRHGEVAEAVARCHRPASGSSSSRATTASPRRDRAQGRHRERTLTVVTGNELDTIDEPHSTPAARHRRAHHCPQLPEAKLRIADALRAAGRSSR